MMTHPILTYHELSKTRSDYQYVITDQDFEEHLNLLYVSGYRCLLVEDYYHLIRTKAHTPSNTVIITFDDGHESHFTMAYPALMRFGFKATFFITTDWIGKPGYMSKTQLRELADRGMSVQSHAKTHTFLDTMEYANIYSELEQSKAILEGIIDRRVRFLSLPGGRHNGNVMRCAAALGYAAVFCSIPFYFRRCHGIHLVGRCILKYSFGKLDIEGFTQANLFEKARYRIVSHSKDMMKRALGNNLYYFLWKKYIGKRHL